VGPLIHWSLSLPARYLLGFFRGCPKRIRSWFHTLLGAIMNARNANIQTGKCKLCLKEKDLQDSHYLSAGLYRIARKRGGPEVRTPKIILGSDRQIHEYLLCRDCEQLFSRKGEDYVLRLVKQSDVNFPLLTMLNRHIPIAEGPNNGSVFSGSEVGIDSGKLGYYALSMFWRGSVHAWKTLNQQTTSVHLASKDQEAVRKFLIGETGWPPGIIVQVTACTDLISQDNVLAPVNWENDAYVGCSMVVFGLHFELVCGVPPGSRDWNLCCVNSPARVIFRHTFEDTTRESLKHMRSQAKIAATLKRKKE